MTTRDDIALAFYKTIVSDATIINSTHLNGSNKVTKSTSRPPTVDNPFLTIDVIPEDLIGESNLSQAVVRTRLFIDNGADGDPDHARAKRIEDRLTLLFHEQDPTGNPAVSVRQCVRLNAARSFFDPTEPSETVFVNDFRIWTA